MLQELLQGSNTVLLVIALRRVGFFLFSFIYFSLQDFHFFKSLLHLRYWVMRKEEKKNQYSDLLNRARKTRKIIQYNYSLLHVRKTHENELKPTPLCTVRWCDGGTQREAPVKPEPSCLGAKESEEFVPRKRNQGTSRWFRNYPLERD